MRQALLAILIFSLGGCYDKKNLILTGGNYKYWDISSVYSKEDSVYYSNPLYSFKFDANGECLYYYYKQQGQKVVRTLFDFEDVEVTNEWEFKGDSIINMLGYDYKILLFNSDSIILFNENVSEMSVMVASPN
jgi:hypothetical protein